MKKQDLKSGMTVEYRDGDQRLVLLNSEKGDILVNCVGRFCGELEQYNENLKHFKLKELDIVKVLNLKHEIIWERKEVSQQLNVKIKATLDQEAINNIKQQIEELKENLSKIEVRLNIQ